MAELAKVFEDRGQWRVEWFDDNGRCQVEIFTGPDARAKALRSHSQERSINAAVGRPGEVCRVWVMTRMPVEPSRVGEYRNQAATLRSLAFETRFRESRVRLLALADSFDKLAERVETRETSAANAAD
jgi:hypothetical protein